MSRDQTPLLRELFRQQSAHAPRPPSIAPLFAYLTALRQHPMFIAIQAMHLSAHSAMRSSERCIAHTLEAIDVCTTTVTRYERDLLLCEAQLLYTSTALKEFEESVAAAQKRADIATATPSKRSRNTLFHRVTGRPPYSGGQVAHAHTSKQVNDEDLYDDTPSAGLLMHYKELIASLQTAVAAWRLKVTLCKEELALYKTEMVLFPRCHVLSCEGRSVLTADVHEESTADDNKSNRYYEHDGSSDGDAHEEDRKRDVDDTPRHRRKAADEIVLRPRFGLVNELSRQTRGVMNDVWRRTTLPFASSSRPTSQRSVINTSTNDTKSDINNSKHSDAADADNRTRLPRGVAVGSARRTPGGQTAAQQSSSPHAATTSLPSSSSSRSTHSSSADTYRSNDVTNHQIHTTATASNTHAAPIWTQTQLGGLGARLLADTLNYTADEEAALHEQNQALEQRQRAASAHDAKAVEAAVRDLSQLTSLMNEHVMQQNEQFTSMLRNTAEAQRHVEGAVKEVTKATTRRWNTTRQLVVLLVFCSMIILVFNAIIG